MKRAFSLIELSIVILIIGILVAGVTQSSRLVSEMRLSSAKRLTQSSPISSIKGLLLWLETSSDNSFDNNVGDADQVANWYDLNPLSNTKYTLNQSTTANRPTYIKSSTGGIPALKFNNSKFQIDNFPLNSPSYSMFIVFNSGAVSSSGMDILSFSSGGNHGILIEVQPPSGAYLGFNRRLRALHRSPLGSSTENDNYTNASSTIEDNKDYIFSYVRNYNATPTSTTTSSYVGEGGTMSISTPTGTIISSILFASYGLPDTTNWVTTWCHASGSMSVIQSSCLNRNSCSVGANNGVFGDPCGGWGKALAVRYTYSTAGLSSMYLNGNLANDSSYSAANAAGIDSSSISMLIGNLLPNNSARPFLGSISEIIIFERAVKDEERKSIEQYLGKKYNIKVSL